MAYIPHVEEDPHRYDDMLMMPHHVSDHHPPMSLHDRAAQFSPFAALTGYDAAIIETGRLTDEKILLTEGRLEAIDLRLRYLKEHLPLAEPIEITYFLPDKRKEGGSYVSVSQCVKKIDDYEELLVLSNGTQIRFEDILEISGTLFAPISNELD